MSVRGQPTWGWFQATDSSDHTQWVLKAWEMRDFYILTPLISTHSAIMRVILPGLIFISGVNLWFNVAFKASFSSFYLCNTFLSNYTARVYCDSIYKILVCILSLVWPRTDKAWYGKNSAIRPFFGQKRRLVGVFLLPAWSKAAVQSFPAHSIMAMFPAVYDILLDWL